MSRAMASIHDKKDQTWEFFRIQAGLRPDARKEFERKFERKVMNGLYSNSNAGQKSLQEWTDELQAEAQATERLRRSWRTPAPNGADNGRSCGNEESSLHRRTLEHETEVRRRAGRRGRFVSRLLHSCLHSRDILATDSSSVFGR